MKNNIQKGFYLVLSVAVVLLLVSFIPKFKIGNKEFKRADLLSDLKVSDGGDIDNPDKLDNPKPCRRCRYQSASAGYL